MSRHFNGTGDRIVSGFTTALNDFTVSAWFYPTSTPTTGDYWRVLDKKYDLGFWLGHDGVGGAAGTWGGGIRQNTSPYGLFVTGFTVNAWNHLVMSRNGTAQRVVGNGSNVGTGTCSSAALSTDALVVGNTELNGANERYPGRVAEVGVWNVALSAAEEQALAKAFRPSRIRPQSLVFYAPLVRELTELKGAASMTATGTTVADHPRVYA